MRGHVSSSTEASGTSTIVTPLPLHPQLNIISTPLSSLNGGRGNPHDPQHVEYRVYNHRRLRNGKVIRGDGWGFRDLIVLAVLVWTAWISSLSQIAQGAVNTGHVRWDMPTTVGWTTIFLVWMRSKCLTVLYETVTPIPSVGIQISITRGISLPALLHWKRSHGPARIILPISTTDTFVPVSDISTVILNQGLTRFKVIYYLAVVKKRGRGIIVALDATRPGFTVLKEVYHGAREIMFGEFHHTMGEHHEHED